jgi:hypothetical protein
MAELVRPEHMEGRVFCSPDLGEHAAHLQRFIDLGFDEVYVHNVGRNQEPFIQACSREVLPALRWPEKREAHAG